MKSMSTEMSLQNLGKILYGLPIDDDEAGANDVIEFLREVYGFPRSTERVILSRAEGGGYTIEPAGNNGRMLGMWPQVRIRPTAALSEAVDGCDYVRDFLVYSVAGVVGGIGYVLDGLRGLYERLPNTAKKVIAKGGRLLLLASLLAPTACWAFRPKPTPTPSAKVPSTRTPEPTVEPTPTPKPATPTPKLPTPTPTLPTEIDTLAEYFESYGEPPECDSDISPTSPIDNVRSCMDGRLMVKTIQLGLINSV
jgi:hypothetical protein